MNDLDHYRYLALAADQSAEALLKLQRLEEGDPLRGSVEVPARGYDCASTGAGVARELIVAYYLPGGRYWHQAELLSRAELGIRYTLSQEKDDGTYDLLETNFHDGAQTSFIVQIIGPAVLLMRKMMGDSAEEKSLFSLLMHFMNRAADGIVAGGFHTPNHRWVLSAALGMCWELTGRQDCLDKMNALLNEGIDCDEEGEYTERSSGVYNIVCDRAFITMAETLGMTDKLEYVRRNLNMVTRYFEPDLTVNTMNSVRQDAGTSPDWRIYYGLYLYMALRTGDKVYRWIADKMLEQSLGGVSWAGRQSGHGNMLGFEYFPFLLMEGGWKAWDRNDVCAPDFRFEKHFVHSGIVRLRRDDFSMTLMENSPVFARLQYKNHAASLRLAGTFYAQGQFAAETIEKTEVGYRLTYRRRWGYKSPLPERQATSEWRKMDHSRRADVMMQDFEFNVEVTPLESGASLRVRTRGVESVLIKFEILLEPGANYITDDVFLRSRPGDYLLQKCASAVYQYDDRTRLCIRGGCFKQSYARNMRGSVPGDDKSFFVAMTADTPMDQTFELTFS
ncbi:MAG: hypothetical protein IKX84_03350 [Clostridia bacterium]|nr:hypothetical protein [Clostridia bacterium]